MAKNTSRPEFDSLSFEVENQELFGKSGASGIQLLNCYQQVSVDCVSPIPMSVREIMFAVR